MFSLKKTLTTSLIALPIIISGCGGSSSDDTVSFNLAVSDAPVDNASKVVVCFSDITIKKDGQETTIPLDMTQLQDSECLDQNLVPLENHLPINLLDAQGASAIDISDTIKVEPGEYSMRISVPDNSGSFVMTDVNGNGDDEQVFLRVPSQVLKLSKFIIAQGGSANFTLEFDLRKSLNAPMKEGADWHLKPNGIRLVDNNEVGHIAGIVSETLLCEGENAATFVYLYNGIELDHANLGDMYYHAETGAYLTEGIEPVASTEVIAEVQADGSYEIGFVATGDYSLGLTCSTDLPESLEELIFDQVIETTVIEKQTAQADFL